jgi:tRNA splicing endonuclease
MKFLKRYDMSKNEFIKKLAKHPKKLEYFKIGNNYDAKAVFTNMSTQNKEWYKIEYFEKTRKTQKRWDKYAVYQSYALSTIIEDFIKSI